MKITTNQIPHTFRNKYLQNNAGIFSSGSDSGSSTEVSKGTDIEIIKTTSSVNANDDNVLSAARSYKDFLQIDKDCSTSKSIDFLAGIKINGTLIEYDSSTNAIKINANLYATGGISALGQNPNTATSGGVSALSELVDVSIGDLVDSDVLYYDKNTSHWKNRADSYFAKTSDLSALATKIENQNNYTHPTYTAQNVGGARNFLTSFTSDALGHITGVTTAAMTKSDISALWGNTIWDNSNFNPASYLPLTGGALTGNLQIGNTTIYASGSNGGINSIAPSDDVILGDCNIGGHLGLKSLNTTSAGISFYDPSGNNLGRFTVNSSGVPTWSDSTIWHAGNLSKVSQLTNDSGYITSSALNGYLPLAGGTLTNLLHINVNGVTSDIGAQNASWFHFYTSVPVIFNKDVYAIGNYYGGTAYNRRLAYADEIAGTVVSHSTNSEYIGNDAQYMRFHWSGQGGQPTWLWGGNDAGNMYVWNPSNFSVNYANYSGYANRIDGVNLSGTATSNLIYATIADNDFFRLQVGGTASNAGYVELATADDGNEPIYVRQYTGVFTNIVRTLILLDESGNTTMPGSLTVNGNVFATGGVTSLSDVRYKNILHNRDIKLEDIAKAPLFDFTLKDHMDKSVHIGTSAQYWKKILPESIRKEEDVLTMDYASTALACSISMAKEIEYLKSKLENYELR